MLKDITLGQYFPGNSPIHRLDPRTKLIMLVVYIVALFLAVSWVSYGLMLVFLLVVIKISTIPLRSVLRGLKPLMLILVLTGIMNLFFTGGENLLPASWAISRYVTISREGILRAIFMLARITMLVMGTFLLTYTTSPISLTDGLESLLSPLRRLHVPVHELSMMMCIALRFIPTLIEETDKIMSAQKARGADFENGNLLERVRALIPVLVPLFISAFRRADELATAMECRCYQGGDGRTKMILLRFHQLDYVSFLVGLILMIGAVLLRCLGL